MLGLPGPLTPLRLLVSLARVLEEQARKELHRQQREELREAVREMEADQEQDGCA